MQISNMRIPLHCLCISFSEIWLKLQLEELREKKSKLKADITYI